MSNEEGRYVVRLRGLPWSATDAEIIDFLDCEVVDGEHGIKRTFTKEGRASGEAYVELGSQEDINNTLDKDHSMMGRRYIEVFQSSVKEMEYVLSRSGDNPSQQPQRGGDTIIRMRGLPYQCTKEDIALFFTGLEIVPNGISLPLDDSGRSTGEAYVEFASQLGAEGALHKHKEKIGHRYIEIFKSTRRERMTAVGEYDRPYGGGRGRPGPYDRPRGGGGSRGMRGGRYGGRGGRTNYGGRSYGGGGDFYDDEEYDDYDDDDDYYDDGGYGNGGGARYRGRGRGGGMKGYGRGGRSGSYRGGGGYGNYSSGGYGNGGYDEDDDYYDDGGMMSQHVIHLRGLPFKASDDDISSFFSPIVPVRIHREYGRDGRVSGEADVEFASDQDVHAAMQKDGGSMMHRYIELFLRGPGASNKGGRGGRRRGGGGGYGGGRGGGYRY